jgi:hypothetical protein
MTTFGDQVFEFGGAPVGNLLIPPGGIWYFVDGANGVDTNDGLAPTRAKKTLSAAYNLTRDGKNDVVCVLASTSAINETAVIVWSNNLTHCIGLGALSPFAQRTRIVANATGLTPFITISGYGCIFSNLYLWQGQNEAVGNILVTVTSTRNFFNNVHFAGGGHAAQAISGGASLKLDGGQENLFKHCTIGVDTVVAATGMTNLSMTNYADRNVFEDCLFMIYAGSTGTRQVILLTNTAIDRVNIFKRCLFINDCRSFSLASVFTIPASMGSVTNYLLMQDCVSIGADDWDSSNRGILYLNGGTATAGGATGLFQASNST